MCFENKSTNMIIGNQDNQEKMKQKRKKKSKKETKGRGNKRPRFVPQGINSFPRES